MFLPFVWCHDAHDDVWGNGGKILFECICFPTHRLHMDVSFYGILTICCDYGFASILYPIWFISWEQGRVLCVLSNRFEYSTTVCLIIIRLKLQFPPLSQSSLLLKHCSQLGSVYKMVASLAGQLMLELKHMCNACTSLPSRYPLRSALHSPARGRVREAARLAAS